MNSFEENLYKFLGQDGIFRKNLANNDFELEFGKLIRVTSINNQLTYFNQNGDWFNSFMPSLLINASKQCTDTEQHEENSPKVVVSNTDTECEMNSEPKSDVKSISSDVLTMISHYDYVKNPRLGREHTNNPMSKYVGKFGIVYNDSDVESRIDGSIKGINGFGLRLVPLTGIKRVDGKIKYMSTSKIKNFYYYRYFDHFRPISKEELENDRLGIGYSKSEERKCSPRLAIYRYKVDDRFKTVLYQCSAVSYERTYDEFVTLKDLNSALPLAIED